MNYIYDIVLNFQDNYYNFFEWARSDKIKNVSKIPVYRVTDQDILNLKDNQVKLDNSFLNKIKEEQKKKKNLMFLVSNTKISLGILIDEEGNLLKRSSLIFEEEEEVNDLCKTLPLTIIEYQKNKKVPPKNRLRIEIERKDLLIKYLNKTNDLITLKYLYYEYFKEECEDILIIKTTLLKELEKSWNKDQNNLYTIVNLLTKKNLLTNRK